MEELNNLWFNLLFLKQGTPGNVCQKPLYLKMWKERQRLVCAENYYFCLFIYLFLN